MTALITAVVLAVIGGLTMAGGLFMHSQVTDQLTAQKISFAPQGSPGLPANIQSYGGTKVTNGAQAKVFSDQYIKVHILNAISEAAKTNPKLNGVTTYSELSSLSRANPKDETLAGLVQTTFRGEMLRNSLLSSYAWWTFGTILFWIAIAAFALAFLGAVSAVALATPLGARLGARGHGGRMAHA